jgi:plastocyanin
MRLLRLAVAALFAALVVAACSSNNGSSNTPGSTTSGGGGGGGGGSAAATITIKDFKFGDPITVKPGAAVKVTNADGASHNVTSDDGNSFKTADLAQGESATFTAPSTPGTYKFSCTLHSNMSGIGTLTVQG